MQFGFGSGLLYTQRTDIANQGPIRFGAFQDLQLDFSGDIKELFGQNQFALDVARGKVKITGKAKLAQISAPLMNAVFFGGTIATGQTLTLYQEAGTIPGTPYQITVAQAATFTTDLGVTDLLTGNPLTRVASAPITGQYSVNLGTGVFTFAAADTTKAVLIDYAYTATSGFTMASGNPLMGNTPRFASTFTQKYGGNTMTISMPYCVGQKFTLPTKLDDYVMEELDFQAFAGATGSPITISASN
jgi:hypothetical protein